MVAAFATTISIVALAQDSAIKSKVAWSAFADVYYAYDFNQPASHEKAFFLYNHKRHNEVNLNLALVQASFKGESVRANLALQTGNYAEYNYAAEQGLLRNVYQANAGVKLASNTNLWLDAGIFPSHIGYESAISKDNWSLTRSLMAENSPYYEAGAKLSYTSANNKWFLSALYLNGWQRISRVDGNNTPNFGTQITYMPNSKASFNWSTFTGNDYPDSTKRWRYFSNLFAIIQVSEKLGISSGFDIGMQQQTKGSSEMDVWFTPNLVVRYAPNDYWVLAARGEYYSDTQGVIISTGTTNGFKTFGGSVNIDRKINNHFWWRTEVRTLQSRDAIFLKAASPGNNSTFVTTSLAISL